MSWVENNDVRIYWSIRQEHPDLWPTGKRHPSSLRVPYNVRKLLENDVLRTAFDPLLRVRGLRYGMRFTTLHKLYSAKCDEEAAAYLTHIYNIFRTIVGGDDDALNRIAADDVRALELRCPRFCTADAEAIEQKMRDGSIFTSFSDTEKSAIRAALFSVDCIIPSLSTFFQDMYLLIDCAIAMKHIVTPDRKNKTIRQKLYESFQPRPGRYTEPVANEPTGASFGVAMEQLWCFAMRNYQMLPAKPQATRRHAQPYLEEPDPSVQLEFASLAQQLGFVTPEITELVRQLSSVRVVVTRNQNLEMMKLSNENISLLLFQQTVKRRDLKKRKGRPVQDAYQQARHHLTDEFLTSDFRQCESPGSDLTPLFILRCQYLAFFHNRYTLRKYEDTELTNGDNYDLFFRDEEETICIDSPRLPARHPSQQPSRQTSPIRNLSQPSLYSQSSHYLSEYGSTTEMQETANTCLITFRTYRDKRWEILAQVDADYPEKVESIAQELLQRMYLFSETLDGLIPENCCSSALKSRTKTIIALPKKNSVISDALRDAILVLPAA